MKKTALLIDGAYLRAIATARGIKKYTADFIEDFAWRCFDTREDDPVRILYYDSLPDEKVRRWPITGKEFKSTIEALWEDDLPRRELFAVRLGGKVHFRGWRRINWSKPKGDILDSDFRPDYVQKGVDMRIGLDMATFSYEKTVERIILVTGDTDFIPAMKMVRRAGLQIILVQLLIPSRIWSLLPHADIVREVDFSGNQQ